MTDTIIFFVILGIIALLILIICFWAISAFLKLIIAIFKKFFKKEDDRRSGGVEVNVKELEESRQEHHELERMRQPTIGAPPQKIQEQKTETKTPVAKKFSDRELKRAQEQVDKLQLGSQIKIPVAKDTSVQYQGADPFAAAGPPAQGQAAPVIKKSQISGIKHDSSLMFEGGKEVSRINLRQKLRSAKVYQAQREVGLSLTPIERAKLEKEVFSRALGGNISKTDLKWGLKKLNQKMVTSKNLAEKGKIRKEIKFFKKIGGIKY